MALMLAVVAIATGLRLVTLDSSFYGDEFFIRHLALLPTPEALAAAVNDTHPPLYPMLVHAWASVRWDEAGLRIPSVIAGIALVPVVYLLGRRLLDAQVGMAAAALSASSPFLIAHSQEARSYSLLALLGTLSLYFFAGLVSNPGKRLEWVGYVVFTILGIYTHYYALLLPAAEGVYLVLCSLRRWPNPGWRRWLLSQLWLALAMLPYAAIILQRVSGLRAGSYGQHFVFDRLAAIPEVFVAYTLGYSGVDLQTSTLARSVSVSDLLANLPVLMLGGLTFGVLTLSGVSALRTSARQVAFMLCCILVPIAFAFAFGLSSQYGAFRAKFLIASSPILYLLMALGWVRLVSSRWKILLGVSVAVLVGYCLYRYYYDQDTVGRRTDERGLADFVRAHAVDGDLLLAYRLRNGQALNFYDPGPIPQSAVLRDGEPPFANVALVGPRMDDIVGNSRRVWLVSEEISQLMDDPNATVQGWLDQNYLPRQTWHFGKRLTLRLYERPPEKSRG